jgi:hypothetical protein
MSKRILVVDDRKTCVVCFATLVSVPSGSNSLAVLVRGSLIHQDQEAFG